MDPSPHPLISVVIPVRDAADTVGDQLEALSQQTYEGAWEVVLSDNGSSDNLSTVVAAWSSQVPGLRVIDSGATPGAAAARNAGARISRGEMLAFCDADDRVTPRWLAALATALETHSFVAGAIDHDSLNPGAAAAWHFRSHIDSAPLGSRFMPYALSSNMAIWRNAFEAIGGFPEDLGAVGEDMALSWLLQLAGHDLYFEPQAVVSYRHRHDLRHLWQQHVAYGLGEVALYRRFRNHGLPRSRALGAARVYLRLLLRPHLLLRPGTRGGWVREAAKRYGRVKGSLRERVLYL